MNDDVGVVRGLINIVVVRGRPWLNQHSSCTTNVYKLGDYAGSIMTSISMRMGYLVGADWQWLKLSHH